MLLQHRNLALVSVLSGSCRARLCCNSKFYLLLKLHTTMLFYFHTWVCGPQRRVKLKWKGYFIYVHLRNIKKKSLATQAADIHSLCQIGWLRFGLAMESTNQDNLHITNKTHPDDSRYQNTLFVCMHFWHQNKKFAINGDIFKTLLYSARHLMGFYREG